MYTIKFDSLKLIIPSLTEDIEEKDIGAKIQLKTRGIVLFIIVHGYILKVSHVKYLLFILTGIYTYHTHVP